MILKDESGRDIRLKVDRRGLPIIDQFSEEGFVDCVFGISNLTRRGKHYAFHLGASHGGKALGLDVRVVKGIKAGFNSRMELGKGRVYRAAVQLRRSGAESDRLISTISKLYGLGASRRRMVASESFTGIALHQGSLDVETEPVKIKIFGNDGQGADPGDYYESFFNLDLAAGFVFWNEKDQDYREPLVRSLSAASGPR